MNTEKTIALVAHDNRKQDLLEWVEYNNRALRRHRLICTGTTGTLIEEALRRGVLSGQSIEPEQNQEHEIVKLKSGPLGGDLQLGSLICEGKIDMLIFLWDPMEPHPHDVDVKALLRAAVLYNVPTACNRSTADFLISSSLFDQPYRAIQKDYSEYINRPLRVG